MRMQDRYLFKAKTARIVDTYNNAEDGVWVKGSLKKDCEKYTIFQFEFDRADYVPYEVDPETICQCTGVKDKNGNLIWENDIVAYWDSYSTESGLAEADCIGKVVWDDETISFQVTNRLSAESYEVLGDECSVIGNVFDNPELLEE
jgi:uncharacterized phage protein (TIGR01671 family)